MATGDGQSQIPSMLLGTYGKDPMCLVDGRGVVLPSSQPDLQQRQWIPDERDAFISWLRGEFAAANAIIDAMCHHLQMIGKPGEYDFVLTCIQQRRFNWTVVLHMQQYFSVAEVMFALQQVMWQKKQPLTSDQTHMMPSPQFYTSQEVDGGNHLQKEMHHDIHDPRELRADSLIPRFLSMPQPTGLEERQAISDSLDTSGRSDVSSERVGSLQGSESIPDMSVITEGVHPARTLNTNEDLKHSDTTLRASEEAETSSSSEKTALNSHQDHGGTDGDQTCVEKRLNGDLNEHNVIEERAPPPTTCGLLNEDEERHHGVHISSRCFTCSEAVDGRVINVAEGLELFENVLDVNETTRLATLITDLQASGRRGRTFSGLKRGLSMKGRETIQFGGMQAELYNDAEPMPSFLQVVVDRLVGHHIIPSNKVPDSCSIHILDEGDYLPPHIDHSYIERPFYSLSLLSECTLVLGQSLTMDAPGDFKGAFHLSLPIGSLLALQGNSADVARHALATSPSKRISVTLGKLIPNKGSGFLPQMASLPLVLPPPMPVSSSSWSPAYNSRLPTQASKGPNFPNAKLHMSAASGVLPVPSARPPGVQVVPSLANTPVNNMQPLFPTAPGQASAYPLMAVLPQSPWSAMPRPPGPPSRAPSTGTGVFFPSGGVSSGPGRPVATTPQRRQGSVSQSVPLLQKTFSLPASFNTPTSSPSPTKSGKSSHFSGDRDRPLLPTHSRSFSGTTAQELSSLGRVAGKELADLSPTSTTNGARSMKEVKQTPSGRQKGAFKSELNGDGQGRPLGTPNP